MRTLLLLSGLLGGLVLTASAQTLTFRLTVFSGDEMPYHEELTKTVPAGGSADLYFFQEAFGLPGYLPPAHRWQDSLHAERRVYLTDGDSLIQTPPAEGGLVLEYDAEGYLIAWQRLRCHTCDQDGVGYEVQYNARYQPIRLESTSKAYPHYGIGYLPGGAVERVHEEFRGEVVQDVARLDY